MTRVLHRRPRPEPAFDPAYVRGLAERILARLPKEPDLDVARHRAELLAELDIRARRAS
jgi:hypothetical protein